MVPVLDPTQDASSYTPLLDLVDVLRREKPDVIILLGPFVDAQSQLVAVSVCLYGWSFARVKPTVRVQRADLDVTYEQLYQDVIGKVAEVVMEELTQSQLIIIPSMRDVCHDFVFPQAPLKVMDHEVGGLAKG